MALNVLELYSGIGGMHHALRASGVEGRVVAAVDVNDSANRVYRRNFPETRALDANLDAFDEAQFEALSPPPNAVFMSPPCQPFTRNGLRRDVDDARTRSFRTVLERLERFSSLEYVLVENVKGFETSLMRDELSETLKRRGLNATEFLLTPSQFGIPNSRLRYYCLARRRPFKELSDRISYDLPGVPNAAPYRLKTILDDDAQAIESCTLTPKQLKKAFALDVRHADSVGSCCFTKAYGHYLEGTGSVFCEGGQEKIDQVFASVEGIASDDPLYAERLSELELRFFTPKEVARLMCFPDGFEFPAETTRRQRYKLLGNSINVAVVAKLIRFLVNSE